MSNIQKKTKIENLPSISDFKTNEITWGGEKIEKPENFHVKSQNYFELLKYPQIRNIDRNNLIDLVFLIISNNLRVMGSKMHHSDQVLLVNDFVNELIDDYNSITIKEFELIVKNGIRKKYDTDKITTIGMTIVNFNYWCDKYKEEKAKHDISIRNQMNRKSSEKVNNKPVAYSDVMNLIKQYYLNHEVPETNNKISQKKFDDHWINTGLSFSANYIFDQLNKFGKISEKQLKEKMSKLKKSKKSPKSEFKTIDSIKPSGLEYESKRILCCEFYLAKLKKN